MDAHGDRPQYGDRFNHDEGCHRQAVNCTHSSDALTGEHDWIGTIPAEASVSQQRHGRVSNASGIDGQRRRRNNRTSSQQSASAHQSDTTGPRQSNQRTSKPHLTHGNLGVVCSSAQYGATRGGHDGAIGVTSSHQEEAFQGQHLAKDGQANLTHTPKDANSDRRQWGIADRLYFYGQIEDEGNEAVQPSQPTNMSVDELEAFMAERTNRHLLDQARNDSAGIDVMNRYYWGT
ncbi:MAG: hypothetical protein Q9227_004165 [Pyrenula ochraceoflavens]